MVFGPLSLQVSPSAELFELRERTPETYGAVRLRGEAVVRRRAERLSELRPRGWDFGAVSAAAGRGAALEEVVKQLRGRGFVLWEQFFGAQRCDELLEQLSALDWRPGRLGSAERRALRGDLVAWPELAGATGTWMEQLDHLVADLPLESEENSRHLETYSET